MTGQSTENSEQLAELLGVVVDDYLERRANGERPDVEQYVRQHPGLDKIIRQSLGALQLLDETTGYAPANPDDSGLSERKCLGDFQIIGELGRGGMGVVYEAQQLSLNRRVALKVLPFAGALDARQLQRFKSEAQAAALLHHQNIVPVFGIGSDRGVHFYAMQLIEGQTLAEVIAELRRAGTKALSPAVVQSASKSDGPKTCGSCNDTRPTAQAALSTQGSINSSGYIKQVAELGIQAADALDHAHDEGVVHRDVKPSNLILDQRGKLWVTDFGLALVEANPALTMTGDVVGTIRYMSPEQALGKRVLVDQRTDIYSLCATLYELLTLRRVFEGEDRQEIVEQITRAEPRSPRKLNPSIPKELETILTKGLEKNREDRYASASELADDLRRLLDDRPILAKRPSLLHNAAKFSRRHRAIVASAMVLLVLTTIGLLISNVMISLERDEKQEAWDNLRLALIEKESALVAAEQERGRAEATVLLALESFEHVFLEVLGEQVEQEYRSTDKMAEDLEENQELLESVLRFYEKFAEQSHDLPIVRSETGKAYLRIGQIRKHLTRPQKARDAFERAVTIFQELVGQFPDEPDYAYQLGLAHLAMAPDGLPMAVEVLRPLVDLHPNHPDYLYALGIGYRGTKQTIEATEIFEQLKSRFPLEHKYQAGLAMCYRDERRTKELEDLAKAFPLEEQYQNRLAMRYYTLGHELMNDGILAGIDSERTGCWRKALERYQQSLELYTAINSEGGMGLIYLSTGNLLQKMNRHSEAKEALSKGVESFQRLVAHRHQPWNWRMLGDGYLRLGDVDNAIIAYQESAVLQEAKANAFSTRRNWDMVIYIREKLVGLHMGAGQYDDAYRSILIGEEVVEAQERDRGRLTSLMNELAWIYATADHVENRDPDRALELALQAVKFSPDTIGYQFTLGVVHCQRDDWRAARDLLEPLVSSGHGGSLERLMLSIANWHLDRRDDALRWYEESENWKGDNTGDTRVLNEFRQQARQLLEP